MTELRDALQAWGRPDFEAVLKQSIAALDGGTLPLQQGLRAGSYALDSPVEAVILRSEDQPAAIEVKLMVFYKSVTPGCACAGDPTIESELTEECLVRVRIDKQSAAATFELLDE